MIPSRCLRTYVDPLYGSRELPDYICKLILAPETQRLRYVRLSNIDSLQMPGIAGITRFEHSIGTCVLAMDIADRLSLTTRDRAVLMIGALLHDVAITPFGHLMEEAYKFARIPFNHESKFRDAFTGHAGFGNINMGILGSHAGLTGVLKTGDLKKLEINSEEPLELSNGRGRLGPLIAGTVDLDNIDNVCRVAFHLGMDIRKTLPSDVASGFFFNADILCYNEQMLPALHEWLAYREHLYNLLMTNPYDFSAKALIVEAVRIGLEGQDKDALPPSEAWKWTDAQLLAKLQRYRPTSDIIQNVLAGTLREPIGMYWINNLTASYDLCEPDGLEQFRQRYANRLQLDTSEIIPYVIKDKRKRVIDNLVFVSSNGTSQHREPLGTRSDKLLVGVTSLKKTLAGDSNADRELIAELTALCNGIEPQPCEPVFDVGETKPIQWTPKNNLFTTG